MSWAARGWAGEGRNGLDRGGMRLLRCWAGTGERGRARIGPVEADLAGTGRRGEVLVLGFGLGYVKVLGWFRSVRVSI